MKVPDNGLIRRLASWVEIISMKNKDRSASDISLNPIAGGPYILKSWTKSQKMVLEANPTWWANDRFPNRPQIVVMRPIAEATTRVKALLAGEIDIAHKVLPHFIPQIKATPNLDAVAVSSVRTVYAGFFTTPARPSSHVLLTQPAT